MKNFNTVVRFPPSPTGFLHVGNARIAIINWLFAKKNNGKIILRFDDTDTQRSKEEYKVQMLKDLKWLGIEFDETFTQSSRSEIYKEAFNLLLKNGYIYPCFESEEELEMKRKISLSQGKPPIYKEQNHSQKGLWEAYYRFKLKGEKVNWTDDIQGEISYEIKDLSDPVILRANGNFMYTFCSVVDDYLMDITNIIRGADHITNTAIQIKIIDALGECYGVKKNINFGHLPLFQGKEGKISKRVGGFSIMEMRNEGYEMLAIFNLLSKIGLSYYDDNIKNKDELIADFEISNFNKSQILFDFHLIEIYNKKCISGLKFEDVKDRFSGKITEHFFENIKHNLNFLNEIEEWHNIFYDKSLTFYDLLSQDKLNFAKDVYNLIKDLDEPKWSDVLTLLKQNFPQKKGKDLFLPIRLALTGKNSGPEMHFIFSDIHKDLIRKRLSF
jgi:glutamyl-tRNA synthetase